MLIICVRFAGQTGLDALLYASLGVLLDRGLKLGAHVAAVGLQGEPESLRRMEAGEVGDLLDGGHTGTGVLLTACQRVRYRGDARAVL